MLETFHVYKLLANKLDHHLNKDFKIFEYRMPKICVYFVTSCIYHVYMYMYYMYIMYIYDHKKYVLIFIIFVFQVINIRYPELPQSLLFHYLSTLLGSVEHEFE